MNGKGDSQRPGDKKKIDETYERIFGSRDILDFQKGTRSIIKISHQDDSPDGQ